MAVTSDKASKKAASKSSSAPVVDDYVVKTLESAVAPLELERHPVCSAIGGTVQGYFTVVRINSLDVGTLYPAQYRVVTNRNTQSIRLSTWAFRKICELLSDDCESFWISLYAPSKMLLKGNLRKLLESELNKGAEFLPRIVIELSSEVLYQNAEEVAQNIKELHNDFGVSFMLSEYGDEYCPVLRLSSFPVDYVMLDKTINTEELLNGPEATSAIKMAKELHKKTVLDVSSQPQLRRLVREAGIDLYMTGPFPQEREG